MNDLLNKNFFTVSELNFSIKKIIETSMHSIQVKGEISQLKKHSSGHIYFTLKDEKEVISAVCWRSKVGELSFMPEDGKKVRIYGKVTTYSLQSKYQIIVSDIELEGEGELLKLFEELKNKLLKEGLFNNDLKKQLPRFPKKIGIITSETGAVLRDIIHRIRDRFPIEIILFSCQVQGKNAVSEITLAISKFNDWITSSDKKVDLIIIARGGGTLEDLMPFNSEILVRSIFKSKLPIISAVGHETDITLCDFVSDLRAPTPTAAAELAVMEKNELLSQLNFKLSIIKKIQLNLLNSKNLFLEKKLKSLPEIYNIIQQEFQTLDLAEIKLKKNFLNLNTKIKLNFKKSLESFQPKILFERLRYVDISLKNNKDKINNLIKLKFYSINQKILDSQKLLRALSYKNVLQRGYAVVRKNKKIISKKDEIQNDELFKVEFATSEMNAKKIKD